MGGEKTNLLPNVPNSFYSTPHAWELEEDQEQDSVPVKSASKSSKSKPSQQQRSSTDATPSKRNKKKNGKSFQNSLKNNNGSADAANPDIDSEVVELADATRRVRIDRSRCLAMDASVNSTASLTTSRPSPSIFDRLGEKSISNELESPSTTSTSLNTPKKVFVLEKRNNRPSSSSHSAADSGQVTAKKSSASPPLTSKSTSHQGDTGNQSKGKGKSRNRRNRRRDGDDKISDAKQNNIDDDHKINDPAIVEAENASTKPVKKKISILEAASGGADWNDIVDDQEEYDYTPIKWK